MGFLYSFVGLILVIGTSIWWKKKFDIETLFYGLGLFVGGTVMLYYGLVLILNKTKINATAKMLIVNSTPLPTFKNKKIAINNAVSIRKRFSSGTKSSGSWLIELTDEVTQNTILICSPYYPIVVETLTQKLKEFYFSKKNL